MRFVCGSELVLLAICLCITGLVPGLVDGASRQTTWVADPEANERLNQVEQSLTPFEHFRGTSRENETSTIHERMSHWHVAGASLAVMKNFRLDWAKTYGNEKPGGPLVSLVTRFQAASISKFVTAVPLLTRVAGGQFGLDDNINDLLTTFQIEDNEFTSRKNITLRGMMSHTSGLSQPTFPGYKEGMPLPDIYQILQGEPPAYTPPIVPIFEPGSRDGYSGGGTMLEQLLLMEHSGLNYEDLMQEEILRPLGMNSSTFHIRDRSNLQDVASACSCAYNQPQLVPGHWYQYPEQAAAGLWTRPIDLLLFAADIARSFQGEGGLLDQASARQMLAVQLDDYKRAPMMFGLGPNVVPLPQPWFHHGGYNWGYCLFLLANVHGDGMVVATNSDCAFMRPFLGEVFRSIVSVYNFNDLIGYQNLPKVIQKNNARMEVGLPQEGPQDYEGLYTLPVDAGAEYAQVLVTRDSIRPAASASCSWKLYPHLTDADKLVAEVLPLFKYMTPLTYPVPLTVIRVNGHVTGLHATYSDHDLVLTKLDEGTHSGAVDKLLGTETIYCLIIVSNFLTVF